MVFKACSENSVLKSLFWNTPCILDSLFQKKKKNSFQKVSCPRNFVLESLFWNVFYVFRSCFLMYSCILKIVFQKSSFKNFSLEILIHKSYYKNFRKLVWEQIIQKVTFTKGNSKNYGCRRRKKKPFPFLFNKIVRWVW